MPVQTDTTDSAISVAQEHARFCDVGLRAANVSLPPYAVARALATAQLIAWMGSSATLKDAARIEEAFPEGWSWETGKDEEE